MAVVSVDLGRLLDAAEAAAPVEAIDAVAEALNEMVGGEQVSFSDRRFQRGLADSARYSSHGVRAGRETAERVALAGTTQGRALAGQSVEVLEVDGGAVVVRARDESR